MVKISGPDNAEPERSIIDIYASINMFCPVIIVVIPHLHIHINEKPTIHENPYFNRFTIVHLNSVSLFNAKL